jgi:porin
MFVLRRSAVAAAFLVSTMAVTAAHAGAKDENAAEWIAPKWLNEWHDGLAAKGLNFGATWIGDNITNVSGGTSRGAIHFGRLDLSVDGDLEKLVSWTGGKFYANTFVLYGRGLSRNYIHNLATISEIEALPETRLYNAYFEQSFYNTSSISGSDSRRRTSNSSTARPMICLSTGRSAGPPSRPAIFRLVGRRRRSRCPAFASRRN